MEYEPSERRPLMRTISEDGIFDTPQTPVFYNISQQKRRAACVSILLTEMFERLAYYGIMSNFIMFLIQEPFNIVAPEAIHFFFAFTAVSYIFSVLGGLMADTVLGRFKTILGSLVIYIIGIVFFILMGYGSVHTEFCTGLCGQSCSFNFTSVHLRNNTHPYPSPDPAKEVLCVWPLLIATIFTGIGGGSVRANLSPFGAEQVKHEGPETIRTFFNWFYWSINIGSLIALVVVSYVQQNLNFYLGFLIVGVSLVCALVTFVCGRCTFLTCKPTGSVLPNTCKIIWEAFRRRHLRREASRKAASNHMLSSCPKLTFLDMAKKRNGGSFHDSMVEDVKSLKKVIGIFLLLVPYWMVYYQMQSTFSLQGLHMKFTFTNGTTEMKSGEFKFPVAWLTIFDVVVVIVLLPILDRCVYPALIRRGHTVSLFYRILLGMIFSVLAMVVAGGLEIARKGCYNSGGHCQVKQYVSGTTYDAADMWIFLQVPQYVLIGISEVFASVAALEFAYSHAPRSMQGLIMGLFCLSNGIGSLCGSALVALFSIHSIGWFPMQDQGSINNGHLAYYFFVLAGIEFGATLIFCCLNAREYLNNHSAVQTGSSGTSGASSSSSSTSRRRYQIQRKNSSASSSGE